MEARRISQYSAGVEGAGEVDAGGVEVAPGEKFGFFRRALGERGAGSAPRVSGDDGVGGGVFCEEIFEESEGAGKALEGAGAGDDRGDYPGAGGKIETEAREFELAAFAFGCGREEGGVDSVVDHVDAVAVLGRKLVTLPGGRAEAAVAGGEVAQDGGIAHASSEGGAAGFFVGVGWEFAAAMEPLEVAEELGARKEVLHEKGRSRSGMAVDDVRDEVHL